MIKILPPNPANARVRSDAQRQLPCRLTRGAKECTSGDLNALGKSRSTAPWDDRRHWIIDGQ